MKNNIKIFLALVLFFSLLPNLSLASTCKANNVLPDLTCSPGDVLTTNTKTICVSGYTKTVRDVPLSERKQVFKEYGIPYASSSDYEVDHIISLELGGSNNIKNLFPESYKIDNGAKVKDKLENYLHKQVCDGSMTITEAQKEISTNWVKYYNQYFSTSTTTVISKTIISNSPQVKKSTTGICHDKSDKYYARTTNYKPYDSMQACIASGGRESK